MDADNQGDAQSSQRRAGAWADRLAALKNIPPVLHFVWEFGPQVVFWNITIRILVAFLPVGIGIIGRFIIDGLASDQYGPVAGGALLIVILAVLVLALFAGLSRLVIPAGLRKQAKTE